MNRPPVICCCGRKGGVGKTSLSLLLAALYQNMGLRVLLADLDPQASASLCLGVNPSDTCAGAVEPFPGLHVAACLDRVPSVDVVLVDCPPGLLDVDRAALAVADVVLACSEAHRLAVAGAARVLAEVKDRNPAPACALVLGRVDLRRALDRTAPDMLAAAFGVPVFTIGQDTALASALNAATLPPVRCRSALDAALVLDWIQTKTQKADP